MCICSSALRSWRGAGPDVLEPDRGAAAGGAADVDHRIPHAARRDASGRGGMERRRLLLSQPRHAGEGRTLFGSLRSRVRAVLQGAGVAGGRAAARTAGGVAAQVGGETAVAGRDGEDRGAGRLRGADAAPGGTAGGTEGAAPGWVEVDRNRG